MDVFERVRDVNAGTSLTEDRIIAARLRLLHGIDDSRSAERKRLAKRPMFVIAGAVAGVAAVTAGVVVVSQLTAPAPRVEAIPAPTVEPREPGPTIPKPAPTSGTTVTEPYPGTTPQAGQYLSIVTTDDRLWYRGPYASLFEWSYRPAEYPPISAALMRSTDELYVPSDRAGEWIGREGPGNERLQYFSQDVSGGDQVAWDNMLPYRPEIEEWSTVGGRAVGGGDSLHGSLDSYAAYPADPQALLQYLRDQHLGWGTAPDIVDEVVISSVIDELAGNFAPAAVRETFVEALALSDRSEEVSSNGAVVTYRIRFTVMSHPRTVTISVDTATGWATELTSRFDRIDGAEGDMVPNDIPDVRKTFSVSIVNAVP